MSEQAPPRASVNPSRIFVDLAELSAKQRKAVLGLLKDMGFAPGEVSELVVVLPMPEEELED
jgi:hypothetical protein